MHEKKLVKFGRVVSEIREQTEGTLALTLVFPLLHKPATGSKYTVSDLRNHHNALHPYLGKVTTQTFSATPGLCYIIVY